MSHSRGMPVAPVTRMQHPVDTLPLGADILCFSHRRWSFVYQRPQHLMSRYAISQRVFFIEEPVRTEATAPSWGLSAHGGVTVAVPQLPLSVSGAAVTQTLRDLVDALIRRERLTRFIAWYYTPAALPFTAHLVPVGVVYDCMDELAAFKGADPGLPRLEAQLMAVADVVFTGGHSLYEAKCYLHENIHAVPSSVDTRHFAAARHLHDDPDDQRHIPSPRLGYFGVLDQRLDVALLAGLARVRPDYHWVLIGPVVKIDPGELPTAPNIHYLGPKAYEDLPAYIAGWDVALLPFAVNEATRYISPAKTPEYLAAGKPVVSTPIRDVIRIYGERDLVRIAADVDAFARHCDRALTEPPEPRRVRADVMLRGMSWDRTWARTAELVRQTLQAPAPAAGTGPTAEAPTSDQDAATDFTHATRAR